MRVGEGMASNAVQKAVNKVKGKLEERCSPVEKDQATVPIADAMRMYWDRDMLSFAIPAHRDGGRGPAPEFTRHPAYRGRYQRTKKRLGKQRGAQGRPSRHRPPARPRDLAHADPK